MLQGCRARLHTEGGRYMDTDVADEGYKIVIVICEDTDRDVFVLCIAFAKEVSSTSSNSVLEHHRRRNVPRRHLWSSIVGLSCIPSLAAIWSGHGNLRKTHAVCMLPSSYNLKVNVLWYKMFFSKLSPICEDSLKQHRCHNLCYISLHS
jgi:hypothetical protein